jgi:TonB-linked SusC/RagA family outer membrane protein
MCLLLAGAFTTALWAQNRVSGTVVDQADNSPLAGANISVVGTTKGTMTNADGQFTLDGLRSGQVLKVSYLGYTTQEITYKGEATLNIAMAEDAQALGEVVVTALGITKDSKKLGFAVTTIGAAELTKVGTPNFATALYGKAPGVRIQTVQGGSIAGVSMQVRGVSSIDGSNQPLVILNGVPIRNGGTGSGNEATFAEFGAEGRIRSNGLIDVNPEDIESLSILKGAAATALYGSEAANGVVMITSKRSAAGGVSVDFNASLTMNLISDVPPLQKEYGPGGFVESWNDYQKETGGFYERTYLGKTYKSLTYGTTQWGPRYDGSKVLYIDGTERSYLPYTDKPWMELFRNGWNQNYNLAINYGTQNASTRFSYTYNDEIPNALNANYQKHNFTLTGTMNFSKTLSIDYSANYVVQNIHNRATNAMGLYGSFSNAFGSFIDVGLMRKMYKTSLGYKNTYINGEQTLTPDEVFAFDFGGRNSIQSYFWDVYDKQQDQISNRFISSVTPKWKIFDFLVLRGQLSADLTNDKEEYKYPTERPLELYAIQDAGGSYNVVNRRYDIIYGDVMLSFNKDFDKLNVNANVGWQGRQENMFNIQSYTDGGLANRNWYSLAASRLQARTSFGYRDIMKSAYLGTLGFGWDNFLFLEATGRYEQSSTLLDKNGKVGKYFYPSFSASLIYTDLFRESIPYWWDYGKLRASYGIVGNAPEAYSANEVYEQGSNNGMIWNYVPTSTGNNNIKPEVTREFEIGLENKFAKDRFGFEVSYYKRNISDLILSTPVAVSSGTEKILLNVGGMQNTGFEFNIHGNPVMSKDFGWRVNFNMAFNRNKVTKLIDNVDRIENAYWAGGGAMLYSLVGRPMGDIYTQVWAKDENGNYLVDDDGYYLLETDRQRVGNAMPVFTGGFMNTFNYKGFYLDALIDFSYGGYLFNEMFNYMTAQGLTPRSLEGRDTDHGGLSYYFGSEGLPVQVPSGTTSGPGGERVYHNGVIQPGVNANTGQPNNQIVPVDMMTYWTFNWGTDSKQMSFHEAVVKKDYIKFRELALGYTIPQRLTSKFNCRNLQVSLFARNLFYIYKAMPDWDVESSIGTNWKNQAQIGGSTAPQRSFGITLRSSF